MADSFGTTLRLIRNENGISLAAMAKKINYSKSYLSKIENDLSPPTADIARRCDGVLGTGGTLSEMIAEHVSTEVELGQGEVWVMVLDVSGTQRFHRLPRRQVLAGMGAAVGFALTGGSRPVIDEPMLAALRSSFDYYRTLGTHSSPALVLAPLVAHVNTLHGLAAASPAPLRSQLLLLASHGAEYAGWMSQEAGDEAAALWWTRQAVECAVEAGNDSLASYALVRRAEIAMYHQDPFSTIDLAQRAQADRRAGSRVLGLAARCEAQGHALIGDLDAYRRSIGRATALLAERDSATDAAPVLGSASVSNEVALVEGWSLYDLGRPAEAAERLDRHVPEIARGALRARARFGSRRVLAHAGNGEIDHACELAREVIEDAARVDSATIRIDLRELAKLTARWHTHAAVRDLRHELSKVLRLRMPPDT
ncbi:helix-turn-helix domain-containing protein [Amycolatopsis sp. NPDC049252]|uniref:helix-turn-helix domain-containing protein n=1 Tax=Amycolatopsis sp. NPDC049252 TaxID=3363933 RepID=UPI0037241125